MRLHKGPVKDAPLVKDFRVQVRILSAVRSMNRTQDGLVETGKCNRYLYGMQPPKAFDAA